MKEKPLQLIHKPNLIFRKGQKDLYELICAKLIKNEPLTYEEVRPIYFTHACNILKDGWPHSAYMTRNIETDQWENRYYKLSEDEVKYATFNWLTRTIGVLVMKGALKIIPQIQLS
jgi:hypothetical protein